MALTVAQLVARVTADTSGFYRSMAIMNASMIRTGGMVSRIAAGVGLAVGAIGIISLRSAGNYQQAMNILQAVSGATTKEMAAMDEQALKLGKDFKLPNVSARDAANAMAELAKGGLSVNQILGATRGTLQLGLAANLDFAESAKLTARTLKAFDLAGTDAGRVANVFAAAANKSTAEIYDLALGTQNAAAQFHGVGYSVEDLNASLAILADNALAGEYAGTALKTMVIRLTSPTNKAAKEMEHWGISIFDAKGNMKGMPDVIAQFRKGLGGLTQEQREQALTTIFGVRANQAMRILMGEGEKGYLKYRDAITGTNAAQKIAEARTKGFMGALGAAGSAVDTLAVQLGTALLPSAEAVVRAFATFVAGIDPDAIIDFVSGIKDLVVSLVDFIKNSDAAQYALAALAGALTGLYVANKLIGMFRMLQGAWMALNASFALSPIGLIVIALAALVGGLVLAYMKVEWFRNAVDAAFAYIKGTVIPILKEVAEAVISAFGSMAEWISDAMDDIMAVIRTAWAVIGPVITSALKVILKIWELTWGQMVSFIANNWRTIAALVGAVLKNVLTIIQGVLTTIKGVINVIMGVIRGDWDRAWQGIKQILSGTLGTIFNLIKNTLTNIVPLALKLAIAIGKAIWNGIKSGISALPGLLWELLKTGIAGALVRIVSAVGGWASAIGHAIIDGIVRGLTGLAGAVWNKIKEGVGGAIGSAVGWLKHSPEEAIGIELSKGIVRGYLLGQNDLPEKVKENIRKALEAGRQVIEQYQGIISAAFARLAEDAFYAFDQVTAMHKTAGEKLLEAFDIRLATEEAKKRIRELKDAVAAANTAIQEQGAFIPPVREEDESEQAYQQRSIEALNAYNEEKARLLQEYNAAQTALEEEQEAQRLAKKRAALEKRAAQERLEYEEKRRVQRRYLEDELAQLEAYLRKHPERWRQVNRQIVHLLNGFSKDYHGAGRALSQAFVDGFSQTTDAIIEAARKLANELSNLLQMQSNAKEGPLSTVESWWKGLVPALIKGLDVSPITTAATGIGNASYAAMGPGSGMGSTGASVGTGAAVINNYYIEGSLIREQDLNDRIRQAVNTEDRRGRSILTR